MTAREVLDGIKEVHAAITPGRWHVDRDEPGEVASIIVYAHNDGVTVGTYITDIVDEDGDATFIASAPSTIARLTGALEAALAYGADRKKATHEGGNEAEAAVKSYAYHMERIITEALEESQ